MKIVVISDTHGYFNNCLEFLETADYDKVVHLGDCVEDAEDISYIIEKELIYIAGNNDYNSMAPFHRVIEISGIRVLLTHGHLESVKRSKYKRLYEIAISNDIDIVLYGHTHIFDDFNYKGVRMLNPGSPTYPNNGVATIGLLEINEDGNCIYERIELN